MTRRFAPILCFVMLACEQAGDGRPSGSRSPGGAEALEAKVVRVVDGDTVHVRVNGGREKVRYIGIDTPEVDTYGGKGEPFGDQATALNRRLVQNARVELDLGVEPRDRYERLLAYVRLEDGTFVNAELLSAGLAETMTIAPNDQHADLFARLERAAREQGRGMWAAQGDRE